MLEQRCIAKILFICVVQSKIRLSALHVTAGRHCCVCQAQTEVDTAKQTMHIDRRQQLTRQEEVAVQPAPRSPFNTGSMDITTAGATASLCGHSIPAEKTIVILRHGMTTWNEEQRIQAGFLCCLCWDVWSCL